MKKTYETCLRVATVVKNNGNIYIRCAGQFGRQLRYELQELGIPVKGFLDADAGKIAEELDAPVFPPEYIRNENLGDFFVLVAIKDDAAYEDICKELMSYGLRKGIDFGSAPFRDDPRMMDFMDIVPQLDVGKSFEQIALTRMNEMYKVDPTFSKELPNAYNLIPNLDIPLTTYCSLKCEFCSHCIPYANPPKHFSAEEVASSLDRLLSVSFAACVAIMGGEPFVYPRLTEFIERYGKLKNRDKIGFTRVVTNGTVLPGKDFFEAYSKLDNAYIYISNYGDKSNKIDKIVAACDEYGIKTYICPYNSDWVSLGSIMPRRTYSEDELRHLYAVCDARYCMQLLNGRLYACARTPLLNEDGLIPFCETDYCEVARGDDATLSDRLHAYLYDKPYLEGCRYCDGQHMYSKHIGRGE